MYIQSIAIDNLRCFKKASLDFWYPGRRRLADGEIAGATPPTFRNVNVILGVNGAGKSTILDGIALAVLSAVIASSGYTPYSLVRRQSSRKIGRANLRAKLILHDQDVGRGEPFSRKPFTVETGIRQRGDHEVITGEDESNPIWESMFDDSSPAFLLVGYSATRRVESSSTFELSARRKSRQLRYERVASLFEEHFALTPLTAWLPALRKDNPGRHKQVVTLINRLLPRGTRFTAKLVAGEYLFKLRGAEVPFGALSDGYRAYIGWIADLLHHVCMGCPKGKKLVDNRGIVLVDEIDLHIHPEWQLTIIPRLARALPRLQFILTTHSPIVAGTLEQANVHHLRTAKAGHTIVERPEEELFGLSADQILGSHLFGLTSTRAPSFVKELNALSLEAASGKKGAARELMRRVARGKGVPVNGEAPPDWVKQAARKIRHA